MNQCVSYACNLYMRAWGSSSIEVESRPSCYREDYEEAKWLVDCLKWSVRAATLGVFCGFALCAASSLGASARTIQILTYSTLSLFGASAAALVAPFAKHIFFGAFAGAGVIMLGYSQLPFPAYIVLRPFIRPALAIGAGVGIIAFNSVFAIIPLHERAYIRCACEELSKDYEEYQAKA